MAPSAKLMELGRTGRSAERSLAVCFLYARTLLSIQNTFKYITLLPFSANLLLQHMRNISKYTHRIPLEASQRARVSTRPMQTSSSPCKHYVIDRFCTDCQFPTSFGTSF